MPSHRSHLRSKTTEGVSGRIPRVLPNPEESVDRPRSDGCPATVRSRDSGAHPGDVHSRSRAEASEPGANERVARARERAASERNGAARSARPFDARDVRGRSTPAKAHPARSGDPGEVPRFAIRSPGKDGSAVEARRGCGGSARDARSLPFTRVAAAWAETRARVGGASAEAGPG